MPKNVFKTFCVLFLVVFILGCAKDVKVRSYMQDKPRVDQQFEGNAGYLYGTPKMEDENRKETRKIYVLEFSKAAPPAPNIEDIPVKQYDSGRDSYEELAPKADKKPPQAPKIVIPPMDEVVPAVTVEDSVVEYVVEKDDTLQKISKKFYGAYSKWPKIYEYNRDVIENPDFLKPGIKLNIPMQ